MAEHEQRKMGFTDHLEELRWTIIKCIIALAITTTAGWFFSDLMYDLLQRPLDNIDQDVDVILLSPLDAFLIKIKLAVLTGVVVALPVILWIIWSFLKPGLHQHERVAGIFVIVFGTLFFIGGVAFAYAILPISVEFLASFTFTDTEPMYSLKEYLSFAFRLLLACGVLFEMPVVFSLLTRLGVVSVETLQRVRPYTFIGLLVIAAVLTPPDPFTQVMLVGPLVFLYELSIWLGKIQIKRCHKRDMDEDTLHESVVPATAGSGASETDKTQNQEDVDPRLTSSSGKPDNNSAFQETDRLENKDEDENDVYKPKDSLKDVTSPFDDSRLFEDAESEESNDADETNERS